MNPRRHRPARPVRVPWRLPGITSPTATDLRTGEVLARAFQDDPLFVYVEPDPERRRTRLPWLFTRLALTCKDARIVAEPGRGALLLMPTPDSYLTVRRAARAGLVRTPGALGWPATVRLLTSLASGAGGAKEAHDPRCWYVFILGVDPLYQGHGIGRRLLARVCDQADAAHAGVRLETANPGNIGFYESFGFEVVDSVAAYGAPQQWHLVRPPR